MAGACGRGPCPPKTRTVGHPGHASFHCETRDGLKHGPYEVRLEDGSLAERGRFRQGERAGAVETWHPGGEVLMQRDHWLRGLRHGTSESWFGLDAPEARAQYVEGELAGAYLEWWPDGGQRSAGAYEAGQRVGSWKEWHENAELAFEGSYVDGRLDGDWTRWQPDGAVFEQQRTEQGVLHGLQVRFDEASDQRLQRLWHRGRLVAGDRTGARFRRIWRAEGVEGDYLLQHGPWLGVERGPFDAELWWIDGQKRVEGFPDRRPDRHEGGVHLLESGWGEDEALLWWLDESEPHRVRRYEIPLDRAQELTFDRWRNRFYLLGHREEKVAAEPVMEPGSTSAPAVGQTSEAGTASVAEGNPGVVEAVRDGAAVPRDRPAAPSALASTRQHLVVAVDAKEGRLLWERPVEDLPSIRVAEAGVIFAWEGRLARLDADSGEIGEPIATRGEVVAVQDDLVMVAGDGGRVELRALLGAEIRCTFEAPSLGEVLIDGDWLLHTDGSHEALWARSSSDCSLAFQREAKHPLELCSVEGEFVECGYDASLYRHELRSGILRSEISAWHGRGPEGVLWGEETYLFEPEEDAPWRVRGDASYEIVARDAADGRVLLRVPVGPDYDGDPKAWIPAAGSEPMRLVLLHRGGLEVVAVEVHEDLVSDVLSEGLLARPVRPGRPPQQSADAAATWMGASELVDSQGRSPRAVLRNTEVDPCLTLEWTTVRGGARILSSDRICTMQLGDASENLEVVQDIRYRGMRWEATTLHFEMEWVAARPRAPRQLLACRLRTHDPGEAELLCRTAR
jgi:antitoxin component YwqK of YwqJK toxin-antitoxin module